MKSAREIACDARLVVGGETFAERIAMRRFVEEAIQQARVDGARLAQLEITARIGKSVDWRHMATVIGEFNPADVRNAGDDGDAGKGSATPTTDTKDALLAEAARLLTIADEAGHYERRHMFAVEDDAKIRAWLACYVDKDGGQ